MILRPSLDLTAVVEAGSFRRGAERLGLSPPYVSQLVSDLEARLGRQLLYRSTRALFLTEAGERFLPHARTMAEAFRSGVDALRDSSTRLSGELRVTAPSILASPAFARFLAAFTVDHPGLQLEIDLDDRAVDPVAARVDLAIRVGRMPDDPRLARKLFETFGIVCCARALAGDIASPDDLKALRWLRSPTTPGRFTLTGADGGLVDLAPEAQMVVNDAGLIRAILAEGTGFALFPEFAVREALADGRIVNPLPAWRTAPVPVLALFTERRTALTNARAFVDRLSDVSFAQGGAS